ncbi:hypothetical protein O181_001694 [Austropuccinia psidii MF-1]|uniref:Uncharacterized protein n=1 Tax=Austropuccinia psidii MF-1 TaxID=1389203 RepID=A0A9Q3GC45_9BASI|nr:hypothetical protein [Austropuccinia psidii MF-1]
MNNNTTVRNLMNSVQNLQRLRMKPGNHIMSQQTILKEKPITDSNAINQDTEPQVLDIEEVKWILLKERLKISPANFALYLDYASEDELAESEINQKPNHHHHTMPQSSLVRVFTSEPQQSIQLASLLYAIQNNLD